MRRFVAVVALLFGSNLWGSAVYGLVPAGDLAIIQIKPTSSESVVIENISGSSINLQDYLLEYFNKSTPTNFNIPTTSQQLPNFILQPQQSFLLTGDSNGTCGAAGVASLSISLSDTSGYLEIVKISGSGGNTTHTVQDKVSWTSSASGADVVSVPSATSSPLSVWYRNLSDGSWNKYETDTNPCNLFITVVSVASPTFVNWANGEAAPSEVLAQTSNATGSLPAADIGLSAPQITELLPNPALPQTDSEDEFIELYNPNDIPFDLSGFKLQAGLSTLRDYVIPAGTLILPKSFKAFYSVDTNLAMSNSSGLVKLIDPLGNIVNQSAQYSSAKEGQSWALANGSWYWDDSPSAESMNAVSIKTTSSISSKTTSSAVKAASTSNTSGVNASSAPNVNSDQSVKLHSWTIAVIGLMAILYAIYEYRNDLANSIYKLRRHRATGLVVGWIGGGAISRRIKSRSWWRKNNTSKRPSKRSKKPRSRK